jgi:hypothetical protein
MNALVSPGLFFLYFSPQLIVELVCDLAEIGMTGGHFLLSLFLFVYIFMFCVVLCIDLCND